MDIAVDPHPTLYLRAFLTELPQPLGQLATPPRVAELLRLDFQAPIEQPEGLQQAVRDMLRQGGFKPSGRSKPSSEYLAATAQAGKMPSINLVVDLANGISLHSGWPISVVDLDRLHPPLCVKIAAPGNRYPFNASGQEIDVSGLICLHDQQGPCANAVKDAQRVKTGPETHSTLTLIWGCQPFGWHVDQAERWYRYILGELGLRVTEVTLRRTGETVS
ncbi:MAG: hypothetical protein KatS3mg110_2625 [Pirellulaceae bacterium]|nr:MAG: hypothetical protein KatS3mg110_2625 [Pirellulaceae bacterium]